jgi:hypothetical protein
MAFSLNTKTTINPDQFDYFGGLPVSGKYTQFSASFEVDKQILDVDEQLTSGGTATYNTNEGVVDMAITTTVGSRVIRQTKRNFIYQPGKAFQFDMTGVLTTANVVGVRCRMGAYNDNNGFYLEFLDGVTSLVKRSSVTGSVVNTSIPQSSWLDPMDGTGASGRTLDITKAQILLIEGQFLGVGEVGVSLVYGKEKVTIYKFSHANVVTTKYLRTINLPIRYEIERISGTAVTAMKQSCLAAISSGGFEPIGNVFPAANTTAVTAANGVQTAILAVRPNTAGISLNLISIEASTTSNAAGLVEVHLCSAVTGGAWTTGTNAKSEQNTTMTGFTSLKRIAAIPFNATTRSNEAVLRDAIYTGRTIAGVSEILVITTAGIGATAAMLTSMTYQEL